MFSFGRERAQIELYGKLPLAKDYLRVGCADGAGRELREWLDRAFGSARDAASQPVLGEPLRFLGQASDAPLQGCLWPSTDEGGKRSFPFALFVQRHRKPLVADLGDGLPVAEALWRELEALRDSAAQGPDGAHFLDALRGREIDLEDLRPRVRLRADFEDWLASLWPADLQEGLASELRELRALARDARGGPWRLPLARELPLLDQVLAWTSALLEFGGLTKDRPPTLFFPAAATALGASTREPAFLVASSAPLSNEQVAWLLPASAERVLGERDLSRGQRASEREPRGDPEGGRSLVEA